MTETLTKESLKHKYLPHFLLVVYLAIWAWLAVNPLDRSDWLLENILIAIFIPVLVITFRRFRLSNISYWCIFVYMVMHTIGAHYTYADVPFGFWLQALFGTDRNFYDRIVHFSFGLLLGYPIREVFHRVGSAKGFWGYWFPFELTLAFSALYEIMEWATAVLVDPSAGSAFLGSQGDVWDAQWDMALAGIGAAVSMLLTMAVNWHLDRRFGREMQASLSVKETEPMGEVKIQELEAENALVQIKRTVLRKAKKKKISQRTRARTTVQRVGKRR